MFLDIHFEDYECINTLCYFKKLIDTLIYLPWNNTIEEDYTILVSHKKVDVRNISACVHVCVCLCVCVSVHMSTYKYILIPFTSICMFIYGNIYNICMYISIWYNMQKGKKDTRKPHRKKCLFIKTWNTVYWLFG